MKNSIKVTVNVSTKTEMTDAPWWIIIDPKKRASGAIGIANQITGPFFSREEAQDHLEARHYAFSKGAIVYCKSGYWTEEYKNAYRNADAKAGMPRGADA